MTSLIKKLAILLFSLIVCFLLGELVVRFYLSKKIIYDIEMTRYSLLVKMDSENPLIGHLHRPNSTARLMGVDVHINSDGLRDREYSIKKNGNYRTIFLGDSLTFGWGVKESDTFENILETELNNKYSAEILNFGTGNYNTEQEVNLFFEKGLKYAPDKVVLFYFINDAEPTPRKSKTWFLAYSRLLSFYWSRIHSAIDNLFKSKSFNEYYSDLYKSDQIGWINTQKAILKLKDVCRKNNIDLQVILLPELHELVDYPFQKEHNMISEFLQKNVISSLDLAPFFGTYKNSMELWVSSDDAHPNKLAHKMIAEYSLNFISTIKTGENQ